MRTSSSLTYLFTALHLLAAIGCSDDDTCSDGCAGNGGEAPSGSGEGGGDGGAGGEGGNTPAPTVRVLDRFDAPGVGFDVLVHDETGALLSRGQTDEDGGLSMEIPDGAMVSVLFVDDYIQDQVEHTQRKIFSVATGGPAPKPLVVRYERMPTEIPATGTMTLGVTYPPAPGATKYTFTSTCKRDLQYVMGTSATYPDVPICTPDGNYDLVVVAYDDESTIVGWAALFGQMFEAGASKTHALSWSSEPLVPVTLTAENVPDGALSASFATGASQPGPVRLLSVTSSRTVPSPTMAASVLLPHAASFGSQHCDSASLLLTSKPDGTLTTAQSSRCSDSFQSSDFTWDASRLAAFQILPVELAPFSLEWESSALGDTGDAVMTEAYWGPGDEQTIWRVVHRPVAGAVVLPELPADLQAFAPSPGDTVGALVSHRDYASLEGFDQVLATGLEGTTVDQRSSLAATSTVP